LELNFLSRIIENGLSVLFALFAVVGASVTIAKALSFWKLMFDLYIRPGKSVSNSTIMVNL